MKKLLNLLLILGIPTLALAQLNTLTTTTLSAAIAGSTSSNTNCFQVASATGISGPNLANGTQGSSLFIDRELIQVQSVSGTTICGFRGTQGTRTSAHANSATVWIGNADWFMQTDPVSTNCTLGTQYADPYINVKNGRIWHCTGTRFAIPYGVLFVPPSECWMTAATTAFTTGPALVRAAAGNVVLAGTINGTAGTVTVDCPARVPTNIAPANSEIIVTGVSLLYGVQTAAITSIATMIVDSVTYPTSTAAGAAAAGTVGTTALGTLSVTPTALQLTTTTSGQCFNETATAGTPYVWNTNNVNLEIEQVFTLPITTTPTLQVCGAQVYYSVVPSDINNAI